MKFKKTLFLSIVALLSLGLVGCNDNSSVKDSSSSDVDDSNYVTPPSYDEDAIWFHYYREDNDYTDWDMWLWKVDLDGNHVAFNEGYAFNGSDSFGAIGAYPVSLWGDLTKYNVAIIFRKGGSSWSEQTSDIIFSMADWEKDENNIYHVYFIQDDETPYKDDSCKTMDVVKYANFTSTTEISVKVNNDLSSYTLYKNKEILEQKTLTGSTKLVSYTFSSEPSYDDDYSIELSFKTSGKTINKEINKRKLFTSKKFTDQYNYDGELGAIYTKEKTTFKVWSPVSSSITLNIYDNGTPTSVDATKGSDIKSTYTMTKGDKGVWEYVLNEDMAGKYYTYTVTNKTFTNKEIVDPYAQSAGVNGLRGMIVDFNSDDAKPEGWDKFTLNIHKKETLTVYETHVADVTSSTTWGGTESNAKKYAGMYETGTQYTDSSDSTKVVKTGFDHIKELGVNAVQILPVFDQANDEVNTSFNWGYNPLNYNVIEGSYSSDPYNGYTRIKEFRKLVMEYGNAGINIIMDVVYNHMNSATDSNFNVLVPGYYFRYNSDDSYSNGSGCGNDTASEMSMYSKFIKDSTLFLASTYKLSGFRFDLMGLHDVDTMNGAVKNLQDNYNKDIIVYGEPWTMTTSLSISTELATQSNEYEWTGFAGFNDTFRDAVKGSVFDSKATGWGNNINTSDRGGYRKIVNSMMGVTSYSSDPMKNVNYVSCHDNNTLYDKLMLSVKDTDVIPQLDVLCNALTFTSQGISFMNAGEELLRSKSYVDVNGDTQYDSNSYKSSYKVNELDYSRLITYSDVYSQYQKLIKAKQQLHIFHYTTSNDIKANISITNTDDDRNYIDLTIKSDKDTYRVIHASAAKQTKVLDLSYYDVYLSTLNKESKDLTSTYSLTQAETLILKQNNN